MGHTEIIHNDKKSKEELLDELEELRWKLHEAEQAIEAIRSGQVDAIATHGENGPEIYTLKSADHTYRVLIEEMSEGALILSPEGNILYSNSRFADIIDCPLSKVIGESIHNCVDESSRLEMGRMILQAWSDGAARGQLILGAKEKVVPVQLSMRVLPISDIPVLSMIVTDITDRKDAEALLLEKNNELTKSNADLESFAYIASHDLQEPLRMIASYSMLLLRRMDPNDKESMEFGEFIKEGVLRMQQMLKDLLAYSRVGRIDVRFDTVDTKVLVDQVQQSLEQKIQETGAIVVCKDLPVVNGVRSLLGQVFQNLIENALKFRRPDVKPKVEVCARKKGRQYVFSIKDNGIGIDPKYRDRIFMLFQRLHTRDEYDGSGIGLSITKKIIEFHGGTIWIDSEPGKYSVFYFTLPVPEPKTEA